MMSPTLPSLFASCPDDDAFHEECGVFGILGADSAAALTALGLHALQHRGQEAAGIVSANGQDFHSHHALGHVGETFNAERVMRPLVGNAAIGHVRYSTTGETALRNAQPLFADLDMGGFALAHNGNLTNAYTLRKELVRQGCIFSTTSDTEVIVHLTARAQKGQTLVDRLIEALQQVQGAYALVGLAPGTLMGARDPHGVRPLVLGQLGDSYVLASETCALDIIEARFVRDIEPGEVVIIRDGVVTSLHPFRAAPCKFCVFEYIYFARPDSSLEGRSVYAIRRQIGCELAKEAPVDADCVVPVPDSGVPAAIGYAEQSGIPFDLGIIRSHYVGRTFIQPTDRIRHLGVRLKHNANRRFIEGKRIVLLDDSIVRGTTSVRIVDMLRQAGAKEIHMRISSPPTRYSCYYGINTPEPDQLLAHAHTPDEMAKFIGVDSLAFVSLDGLYRALGEARRDPNMPQFCDACFSGDYAIPLTDKETHTGAPQLSFLLAKGQ